MEFTERIHDKISCYKEKVDTRAEYYAIKLAIDLKNHDIILEGVSSIVTKVLIDLKL